MRNNFGAIPLSSDILNKANIGLWAFELDEGLPPRMYADEAMLGLLGLAEQRPPEEIYHAWYDNIDKSSYELVNDAVARMVAGEHAEVQYPWHYSDGRTIIVRCGGVRNPAYTKGIRIEGTHQDVTKVRYFNDEAEAQKTVINDCVKAFSDITNGEEAIDRMLHIIEDYYRADRAYIFEEAEGGTVLNNTYECCREGIKAEKDNLQNVPKSVASTWYDAFRQTGAFAIDSVNAESAGGEVTKRILEEQGINRLVAAPLMNGTEIIGFIGVDNPSNASRDAEALKTAANLVSNEIIRRQQHIAEEARLASEREQEEERRRNTEIIEILASEYTSVYYIDLTTDELNPYTMNEETETTFGSVFRSGITYSEAFRLYVDKLVYAADKVMMLNAGSIGNIMKELRTKKTFLTTYRNAAGHYSEMKFVKVGNEAGIPRAVALGFADKDAELRAKLEEEQILQRNIDIIEILASEYTSVYYIDLTTDELDPYTMNEETETEFGQIFRSGIKYSDAFKMYVDTLVYPDDKAKMLNAGSIYNILKEMVTKKTFITQYRNSEGHYSEMKFVKVGDEENPQAVALGFADKDEEIRGELERQAIAARDAAVIAGLSDDFGCVVYVSYETNDEIHYRFDPLFERNIPGWSKINKFNERLTTLINTIMHPDDRKGFWEATRAEVVKAAVQKDNAYFVNFRTLIGDEITYYQLKFVRDENTDTHVIAGFHNVDAETKREMDALDKAESASRAKTDFLFNMSHDIRTPMNAIIGFTNIAVREIKHPEKALENLEKVRLSSEMLLSLINNILDMSRIESGKATLNEEKADVMKVLDKVESVMASLAMPKDMNLSYHIGAIRNRYVYADVARVDRILTNIVSNAVKYTEAGGYVDVSVEQIETVWDGYGTYKFVVADNGIGMSEEFQKKMYEEFSREESSTASGIQGTGLGLSLAQKLTQMMGGTIGCKSKQGVGTTFTITLPFRLQTEEEIREGIREVRKENDILLAGKKVLLVEDNDLNREIAADILETQGMTVETAIDGRQAIQVIVERGKEYFDYILMDIQMPVMGGYEATREIRRLMPGLRAPIIALSANAFEEDKQRSIEAGMNDHVAKPIDVEVLQATMAKFL